MTTPKLHVAYPVLSAIGIAGEKALVCPVDGKPCSDDCSFYFCPDDCSAKRAYDAARGPGTNRTPDAGLRDGGEAEAAMIRAREKWAASREAFPPTMVQRFAYADGWHAALAWMAETSKEGEP